MPARKLTSTQFDKRSGDQSVRAVLRARVSTKDQEKEGFSIPAQLGLLREYAASRAIVILEEFVDAESSKAGDGDGFTRMVQYLKKHPTCRTILVEKTDRLYRNPKDWVTLEELAVKIHFVKENVILSPDAPSSEKFMHGMKVLMAKNFIDNLAEETQKGMLAKARAGIYPSFAPVGYRNADGPAGKRIIVPDPDTAPVITELFGRFALGTHSIKALVTECRAEGVTLGGRKRHSSTTHQILRKRLYAGDFDWNGTTYTGTHEPLVTRECWRQVQALLDARAESKTRRVKHDFAYTGLVHCGHCGCLLVGELKKGKYVYYHCTKNRGKCPEPYTPQDTLTGMFAGMLRDFVIPEPVLAWLGDAVLESDRTEQAARNQTIKQLQARHQQIQARIERMYGDRLDGRIETEYFDSHAAEWRREQQTILRKVADIHQATPAPIEQAVDMLQLTSRAAELFLEQPPNEQRHLLRTVMEKAEWKNGTLRATLFEPFEILRHSNRESYRKENVNAGSGRDSDIWLPGMDSNHELDTILKSRNLLILKSR